MTDEAHQAATAPRAEVTAVADEFIAMMRTLKKARARMLAAAQRDVEWAAQLLLKCVGNDGPMRASAIAAALESDPSTVSRQVAALVREGLLERRSDPADGRASLLALTPKADAVLAEHDRIRSEQFAAALDDWSDADLRRFAALLHRFTRAYEAEQSTYIHNRINERMNERIATRSARAGSSD